MRGGEEMVGGRRKMADGKHPSSLCLRCPVIPSISHLYLSPFYFPSIALTAYKTQSASKQALTLPSIYLALVYSITSSRTRQCIRTFHNHLTVQGQHNQVEAFLARCN